MDWSVRKRGKKISAASLGRNLVLSVHGSCRGECCSLSQEGVILSDTEQPGLVGLKLDDL